MSRPARSPACDTACSAPTARRSVAHSTAVGGPCSASSVAHQGEAGFLRRLGVAERTGRQAGGGQRGAPALFAMMREHVVRRGVDQADAAVAEADQPFRRRAAGGGAVDVEEGVGRGGPRSVRARRRRRRGPAGSGCAHRRAGCARAACRRRGCLRSGGGRRAAPRHRGAAVITSRSSPARCSGGPTAASRRRKNGSSNCPASAGSTRPTASLRPWRRRRASWFGR